jgi:hypothetical protein
MPCSYRPERRWSDGEQRYKAIRDRQSLYTTEVQGIPAAPVTRPPSSVAGPTIVEFLDIPILRDMDDMLGFYLAVSGVLPAWPGASVELSLDGGANYIVAGTTRSGSVIGELVTSLGDHPFPFPDTVNTCQVEIKTPNALLENISLAGMMNRRNRAIIGDEIVSLGDVDEVTPGTWEISHWLRGRKGVATEAHAIGERFILLDTVMFIPADLSWLGRDLTFRVNTFGRPLDEATIVTVTFTGQSQVERRPAYLQARRDGNNAVISWQGVGRLGAGASTGMGVHFIGYRVTLTDGITTRAIDTASTKITEPLIGFSGPVNVSVSQRNQLTGLGPAATAGVDETIVPGGDSLWIAGMTHPVFEYPSGTMLPAATTPPLINDGDGLIAFLLSQDSITPLTGWTLVETIGNTDPTYPYILSVFAKDAVTSADSSQSFGWEVDSPGQRGIGYALVRSSSGVVDLAGSASLVTAYATPAAFPHNINLQTVTSFANGGMALSFAIYSRRTTGLIRSVGRPALIDPTGGDSTTLQMAVAVERIDLGGTSGPRLVFQPVTIPPPPPTAGVEYYATATLRLAPG